MICSDTKKSDLDAVARCHEKAFPDALSTKLGHRFCSTMLSWYIESERGIMFHLEHEGEIIGYVGGIIIRVPGLPGSATSITQYSFKAFMWAYLLRPWLFFHPENLKRVSFIWRNIKLKLGSGGKSPNVPAPYIHQNFMPSMGLVVIGVSSEHQGKGYGSVLLKEFESRARREGFSKIHLSVKKINHQAIAAYAKNGWEVSKEGPEELSMSKTLD
jgi:ribosomal protein S18 acetylase RimI-like enzyme